MNFKLHDKLIHEVESPAGLLYRMIVIYTIALTAIIMLINVFTKSANILNVYFLINLSTVMILTWLIRRSFNIITRQKYITAFRVGLFLLLNSTLASLAGGVEIFSTRYTALVAGILYIPAILLMLYSFNKFISYANARYQSVLDLSLTDELTGLPNRRHMNLRLREIEALPGVICIIDIDNFKNINDTFGHDTGDKVLKKVGHALSQFNNDEVFIARSGGEEFSVIITSPVPGDIIRSMKHSITMSFMEGISVTVSIGAAEKTAKQTSSFSLSAADAALYESKRKGKNCVTYLSSKDNLGI